ncbi:MAG: cupredoxin domain-containing protein [Dehalococcoidia bacterium]
MSKRSLLFGALTLLALAGAACSSGGGTAAADVQRLTVLVGDSMSFEPAALTVQRGRPVQLTVRNTGATEHDLVIPALPVTNVKGVETGGHSHGAGSAIVAHPKLKGEVTVSFTPTTAGVYDIACSMPGHSQLGMAGTLTVT